jgi:hypothetical protein
VPEKWAVGRLCHAAQNFSTATTCRFLGRFYRYRKALGRIPMGESFP